MVENCSGIAGDLTVIRWYTVRGSKLPSGAQGTTYLPSEQIVLANDFVAVGPVVRHEMLHALLRTTAHPRTPFLTTCYGIVDCVGACESEAGGRLLPNASSPEMSAASLPIEVNVAPIDPSASIDSGAMSVMVSVTNPNSYAIWIRLDSNPIGLHDTFGYDFDADDARPLGGQGQSIAADRYPLAPSETQRFVWEVHADTAIKGVRGIFNTGSSARRALVIMP